MVHKTLRATRLKGAYSGAPTVVLHGPASQYCQRPNSPYRRLISPIIVPSLLAFRQPILRLCMLGQRVETSSDSLRARQLIPSSMARRLTRSPTTFLSRVRSYSLAIHVSPSRRSAMYSRIRIVRYLGLYQIVIFLTGVHNLLSTRSLTRTGIPLLATVP